MHEQALVRESRLMMRHHTASIDNYGIIVGADANQEWLLPWWWQHYAATNDYPVAFMDYGMSARLREWCGERGRVFTVSTAGLKIMQAKPLALLRSPFQRTLWLDADVEVLQNLVPVFDTIGTDVVGVVHDPYYAPVTTHLDRRYIPVSSGMVVYGHDDPLIQTWAETAANTLDAHGDQVTLNMLHGLDRFLVMPRWFHQLRLDQAPPARPPLTRHWTGIDGKARIRDDMLRSGLLRRGPVSDLDQKGTRS